MRTDKSQEVDSFLRRYFEPLGLDQDDPIVVKAIQEGRVETKDWNHAWNDLNVRRLANSINTIESLNYHDFEGHYLKKVMLMRTWRPLPQVRHNACQSLESMGLRDEFMAWSLRRGDKTTEGFKYTPIDAYFQATRRVIQNPDIFHGNAVPKIFVATDDCSVMAHIREREPDWTFVSECDNTVNHEAGFVLQEMKDWDIATTDEHYRKFFTELFALATAKYYIGVHYTNVAWWAYFMRPSRWSFELIDYEHSTEDIVKMW